MSDCQACVEAVTNPLTHSFFARCHECELRALAHGPIGFEADKVKKVTPELHKALVILCGSHPTQLAIGAETVRGWFDRIAEARAKQ
jgi:hypothetical protein